MKPTGPDASKFPPLIPSGQYCVETIFYFDGVKALNFNIYGSLLYSQLYHGLQ